MLLKGRVLFLVRWLCRLISWGFLVKLGVFFSMVMVF